MSSDGASAGGSPLPSYAQEHKDGQSTYASSYGATSPMMSPSPELAFPVVATTSATAASAAASAAAASPASSFAGDSLRSPSPSSAAADGVDEFAPFSSVVDSMLTDLYQITMAYAYWKADRHQEHR